MAHKVLTAALTAILASYVTAHSMMTQPQSTSPRVCRLGGNPNPGTCPGPCDLTAIEGPVAGRFANFDSPENPAAKYGRKQQVRIKYQRNNHGPGGFVRHTLVPVDQMMNKAAHSRNAFSYNCFGATPVVAEASDKIVDKWGFSMVGNDGKDIQTAYYVSTVTIPDVIPDGKYVFGWVWHGGTGGPVSNEPYEKDREPWEKAYFGDYWSCSFVEISGGAPLASAYTPVFVNDLSKFSDEGCMSGNDAPGVCVREPCLREATYMKPRPFKNDNVPEDLTPADFGGSDIVSEPREDTVSESAPVVPDLVETPAPFPDLVETPAPVPDLVVSPTPFLDGAESSSLDEREQEVPLSDAEILMRKVACHCLVAGDSCGGRRARRTGGYCVRRATVDDQPSACRDACCEYCKLETLSGQGEIQRRRLCSRAILRSVCEL